MRELEQILVIFMMMSLLNAFLFGKTREDNKAKRHSFIQDQLRKNKDHLITVTTICMETVIDPVLNQFSITKTGYLKLKNSQSAFGYTFYSSKKSNKQKPLVSQYPLLIWLNGGPGSSSQVGNIMEFGPILVTDPLNQGIPVETRNQFSWIEEYNVIFFDQPIGTGLSIAESADIIPQNLDDLSSQFLQGILELYNSPLSCLADLNLNQTPLFIVGQSYGGQYVSAIAEAIVKYNQDNENSFKVPLKGIGIGDGIIIASEMVKSYGEFLYGNGMISQAGKYILEERQRDILEKIKNEQFSLAHDGVDYFFGFIQQNVGVNVYDYELYQPYNLDLYQDYLRRADVRAKFMFMANDDFKLQSTPVYFALYADFMKDDCKKRMEFLLDSGLPILVYNGRKDVIINLIGAQNQLQALEWEGQAQFNNLPLKKWTPGNYQQIAGYYKQHHNLKLILLNDAGHLSPMNQPEVTLKMIIDFVEASK